MFRHRFLHVPITILAAVLCVDAVSAQRTRASASGSSADGSVFETGFGGAPYRTHVGPGMDFVQVSWTTHTQAIGQACPFNLAMPSLPPGASLVASYASWNYINGSASIGDDTIELNGVAVTGDHIAYIEPGLCSGEDFGDTFIAEVTGLIDHGGANLLDDVCDKPLYSDPYAFGTGITLLSVYEFQLGPDREVNLWAGFASTETQGTNAADVTFDLATQYRFNDAHFFINALGGDAPGDGFRINGTVVSGTLPGTHVQGNAWNGLLGPLASGNLYDAADGEISSHLTWGDASFDVRTVKAGAAPDCIGHTFAALSHQVECGDVEIYCTAKVNSLGCTPAISSTGTPKASAGSGFWIRATNMINKKNGLLFYGYDRIGAPFQGGHLCVKLPVKRTTVQNSGGSATGSDCSGSYAFDFNAHIAGGTDPNLVPGAIIYAQYWARDPADAFTTSLSNAVGFDICP